MKYIIFILDGAADYPVPELGGNTPLQAAKKPNIDKLTKASRCGLFKTIPDNFPTGSAVANLSILGYDPLKYFSGRGVLEAAAMGIPLQADDVAFRCNTICVDENRIKNHSAGHISSEESSRLLKSMEERFGTADVRFYHGVSYRHVLVLKENYCADVDCVPPHDHVGEIISDLMPKMRISKAEKTSILLCRLIKESGKLLENHPVNVERIRQGKDPANLIWPWSPGKKPDMQTFQERFGIKAAVISAVDLIKGLGIYGGFDVIDVEGATGLYDTNYEGKAEACIRSLRNHDMIYLHVEAADEAGHEGKADLKVKCIEDFDRRLVGKILDTIDLSDTTIAVLPDHPTPVTTKSHARDAVPFIIRKPDAKPDPVDRFDEESCSKGSYGLVAGESFIREFLRIPN